MFFVNTSNNENEKRKKTHTHTLSRNRNRSESPSPAWHSQMFTPHQCWLLPRTAADARSSLVNWWLMGVIVCVCAPNASQSTVIITGTRHTFGMQISWGCASACQWRSQGSAWTGNNNNVTQTISTKKEEITELVTRQRIHIEGQDRITGQEVHRASLLQTIISHHMNNASNRSMIGLPQQKRRSGIRGLPERWGIIYL